MEVPLSISADIQRIEVEFLKDEEDRERKMLVDKTLIVDVKSFK